ncbi:MAG: LmbE family protein [Phycisphaeraceae bacterium]|nr:LmbE family protein [Phycisphaeraceae bacterium]
MAKKRKVAMCLMAHPDDCELLAAGTLALLARKGWKVHIVTMTPGDAGSMELPPEEISAVRRAEGAAGAKVIGAAYHCLESRDLYVTFDEKTLRRAVELTRSIAPTLIITHSLNCYMMDHEITAQIARSVSFAYAVPNVASGPVLPGSTIPHLYYADAIEGMDAYGRPIEPTTYIDIRRSMATKTKMLKCHASQRQWLMKHHGMDQYVTSMQHWCAKRGEQVGVPVAEGFRQHLGHPYPHDCILKKQLGSLVTHVEPED